jgi:CHASE2 domain-containing sensor protein
MRPTTRIRLGTAIAIVAVVVGVASALLGNWITAGAMVITLIGQYISITSGYRELQRGTPDR